MASRQSSNQKLIELVVTVATRDEEAAGVALESHFGSWPVSYTEPESQFTELSLFLPEAQKPTRVELTEFRQNLAILLQQGVSATTLQIRLKPLVNRDWKHSWKRHFKPLEIGGRLLLRPSWSRRKARPGQSVVVLDPGLSFGTGQHPTTSFCLRETVRAKTAHRRQSFLDMGTGSGILAIAAAKLGYRPVRAFDYDPDSIRVARKNAKRNRVDTRIKFEQADLIRMPMRSHVRFDVVCVNILADILQSERNKILNRVNPGGTLVLAGILAREFDELHKAFTSLKVQPLRQRAEGEWKSASYRVPV